MRTQESEVPVPETRAAGLRGLPVDGAAGLPGGCGLDRATRRRTALFPPLLRAARMMAGLSVAEVAERTGRDKAKISRMESGERGIGTEDLGVLLAAYGFSGKEFSSLAGLAASPVRDWWARYPQALAGDFRVVALLEQAAGRILAWQPAGVPELAQVPNWATACARRDPSVAAGDADARAAAVAARQEAVLAGPYPAKLEMILGSPVPSGPALGEAAAEFGPATEEQARRLAFPRPGTHVRYTPRADSWFPAASAFTILEFGSGPAPAVVHLPGPGGGVLLARPRTVSAYIARFQQLDRLALARRTAA